MGVTCLYTGADVLEENYWQQRDAQSAQGKKNKNKGRVTEKK